MGIKEIILNDDTKAGRAFDLFIQALIFLSLVTFSIETLPNLSESFRATLGMVEVVIVIIFSAEYLLRLYYAPKRLRFFFSFYGLIDLFAVLPFYITSGIDLRSIRVFRLLRLFRILKLARYSKAIRRLKTALLSIRTELLVFLISCLLLVYVSSVGIYYFERTAQPEVFVSVFHSMWWAIATLTTVGYGDVYPITVGGKIFTFLVLLVGLGIIALPSGLFASALTQSVSGSDEEV